MTEKKKGRRMKPKLGYDVPPEAVPFLCEGEWAQLAERCECGCGGFRVVLIDNPDRVSSAVGFYRDFPGALRRVVDSLAPSPVTT